VGTIFQLWKLDLVPEPTEYHIPVPIEVLILSFACTLDFIVEANEIQRAVDG